MALRPGQKIVVFLQNDLYSRFKCFEFLVYVACFQDGVEVELADKNGKTPLMLAHGRRHEEVCDYLQRQIKKKRSILPKIDF